MQLVHEACQMYSADKALQIFTYLEGAADSKGFLGHKARFKQSGSGRAESRTSRIIETPRELAAGWYLGQTVRSRMVALLLSQRRIPASTIMIGPPNDLGFNVLLLPARTVITKGDFLSLSTATRI
jgi:hypothetical protein